MPSIKKFISHRAHAHQMLVSAGSLSQGVTRQILVSSLWIQSTASYHWRRMPDCMLQLVHPKGKHEKKWQKLIKKFWESNATCRRPVSLPCDHRPGRSSADFPSWNPTCGLGCLDYCWPNCKIQGCSPFKTRSVSFGTNVLQHRPADNLSKDYTPLTHRLGLWGPGTIEEFKIYQLKLTSTDLGQTKTSACTKHSHIWVPPPESAQPISGVCSRPSYAQTLRMPTRTNLSM